MKIMVPIKRVIDPYVKIRVKSDQSGVETQNVKMSMNPFDEIAVEEAIRLKEQGIAEEVILVTVGPLTAQETLRTGLALGADKAVFIHSDDELEPLNVAKCLQAMADLLQPSLIIMGKQAIDGDNNQTGQMLAALLNWPQGTFASKVMVKDEKIEVTREVDGGLETLSLMLPAVVTTDLRLNEPRYATLPNIMKAKQKPLEMYALTDLNVSLKQHQEVISVTPPPNREAGEIVADVPELLAKLKQAKVLQ